MRPLRTHYHHVTSKSRDHLGICPGACAGAPHRHPCFCCAAAAVCCRGRAICGGQRRFCGDDRVDVRGGGGDGFGGFRTSSNPQMLAGTRKVQSDGVHGDSCWYRRQRLHRHAFRDDGPLRRHQAVPLRPAAPGAPGATWGAPPPAAARALRSGCLSRHQQSCLRASNSNRRALRLAPL